MKPRLCVSAAVLLLAASWPGRAAEPAPEPFDIAAYEAESPANAGLRDRLAFLGYTVRDGRVYPPRPPGAEGEAAPLPRSGILGPYTRAADLDPNIRSLLQTSGKYRIDERNGHILLNLGGDRSRPLTALEAQEMLHLTSLFSRHRALEGIHVNCNCRAMSADNRSVVELLARLERDGLPPDLIEAVQTSQGAQLLASVGPVLSSPVGALATVFSQAADKNLRDRASQSYAASSRLFDGGNLRLPAGHVATLHEGPAEPMYFNSAEQVLGGLFQQDIRTVLGRNPAGQRLLDRFEGTLPGVAMIRIGAEHGDRTGYGLPGAFYNSGSRSLSLIMDHFYPGLRARALELSVPDRVADGWRRDPAALIEFLSADTEEARRLRLWIIENQHVELAHELTHAWQDRREQVYASGHSGALTQGPIEFELEAFRAQHEYLHAHIGQVLAMPAGAEKERLLTALRANGRLREYASFISDPEAWRQGILRTYRQQPTGANDFGAIASIQGTRLSLSLQRLGEHLMDGAPGSWSRSLGELFGALHMAGGSLVAEQGRQADAARTEAFFRDTFPGLRFEGAGMLATLNAESNPVDALAWRIVALRSAPAAARPQALRDADAAAQSLLRWTAAPPANAPPGALPQAATYLFAHYQAHPDPSARYNGLLAVAPIFTATGRPHYAFYALSSAEQTAQQNRWEEQVQAARTRLAAAEEALRSGDWRRTAQPTPADLRAVSVQLAGFYGHDQAGRQRWPSWLRETSQGYAASYLDQASRAAPGSPQRTALLHSAEAFLWVAPESERASLQARLVSLRGQGS
ncbi:MAG TPA: hypothetical protein VNI01_01610 [Elusimicrobiota bacterium]|nr:hypothetical protein [Elusimicrobiota bacterium]